MQQVPAQRIISVTPEGSEDIGPSRSCSMMSLCLMLLTGLAGCGQTSSDSAPNLGSGTTAGVPAISKQGPPPDNHPLTQGAPTGSPAPFVLGNEIGVASGKETVTGGNNPRAVPVPSTKTADSPEPLVVPTWMAIELDSPDVATRLHALETWVQSAPPGSIDPLILAYEDKDERVRARAMELIEQDWARAADAEPSGGEAENTNEIAGSGDSDIPPERSASDPVNQ